MNPVSWGALPLTLGLSLLALPGSAAPKPKKPSAARKTPLAKTPAARPAPADPGLDAAASLEIAPASFTLDGPRSVLHLLVTARYKDGTARDVTDRVTFTLANPALAAVREGIATPRADGKTGIVARLGRLASPPAELAVKNAQAPAPTEFVNDVMPVLAKAGCNSTACHGSPAGKGGLKLSLFGYEPELDHQAIVKDAGGKRVSLKDPAKSLLLQKATMSVAHGGGARFKPGSREYQVLHDWLKEGAPAIGEFEARVKKVEVLPAEPWMPAPGARQRLAVLATMSDGSVQDVTNRVLFSSNDDAVADVDGNGLVTAKRAGETAVMVRYLGQVAVSRVAVLPTWKLDRYHAVARNNAIDDAVQAKLKKLRLVPSDLCTDEEFVRRATLDVCGIIPAPEEVRVFVDDKSPDKRAKLVEKLLARSEFVDLWTMRWNDILRNNARVLRYGSDEYAKWIRDQVAANRPYDQFVRDLVTATGRTIEANETAAVGAQKLNNKQASRQAALLERFAALPFAPAANYFAVAPDPLDTAAATSQLFLGVRIECARCHNHPFEKWTQNDFYGFAAFFTSIGKARAKNAVAIMPDPKARPLRLPRTNETVEPRALDNGELSVPKGGDTRVPLAEWMTSPSNPYFARSIVNRLWGHYFGRGIVEPIDDFRVTNPASNPELLDVLARELVSAKYDLKQVHRLILNSRTYQQSSRPNEYNRDDTSNFARYYPKRMMAEQLYDSISQATGIFLDDQRGGRGRRPNRKAPETAASGVERVMQLPLLTVGRQGGAPGAMQFLDTFGKSRRESVCECERSNDGSMGQALVLLNGDEVNDKLAAPGSRIQQLIASGKTDAEVVEEVYLAALSRKPTPKQLESALALIRAAKSRKEGVEDLAWGLLNSREFLFIH